MSELGSAVRRVLERHPAFEATPDGFAVTTTPFDAVVTAEERDDEAVLVVTVTVPTLDAVVVDETVADVVQTGWLETLERRLAHPGGITKGPTPAEPAVTHRPAADRLEIEITVEVVVPSQGADDAKAVVHFVEGTYLEGVIPGYVYREPVAGLLDQARDRSVEGEPPT